jgi:cytidine deaminase
MSAAELIAAARAVAGKFQTSDDCIAGGVAAAIRSQSGRVYTGICIDTACSMGFCAEHAAIAEMLKARESMIEMAVAVGADGNILAPCGRCREFMWQIDSRNHAARIIVGLDQIVSLHELLPQPWRSREL